MAENQIHSRNHDMGDARIRVWTNEMTGYGQFNVVSRVDYLALKSAAEKVEFGPDGPVYPSVGFMFQFIHHNCDGKKYCHCKPLPYGQEPPR